MNRKINCVFIIKPIICLIIILVIIPFSAISQVSPLYSKHYNYEQFINPAITGRDKSPTVNLSHKQYWLGTKDSPYSTCLGGSMRLGTFDFYNPRMMLNRTKFFSRGRMGFGGMIMQEKDGPLSSYFAEFSYAYFVPLNHTNSELSFGISAQMLSYNVNRDILQPLQKDDPDLLNINENKIIPESGCGIYYHDLQFYAGASVNDLFLSKRPYNSGNIVPNKRDFFFQTGYKFYLKHYDMEPSLYLAKIDNKQLYYFNQVKFYYMNYNWLAIGYKSTKSFLVSLGFSVRRLYIAYAYEQNISDMGSYFNGSHEIMFGLNIGLYEPLGLRKKVGKKP